MAGAPKITIFSDFTDPASIIAEDAVREVARSISLDVEFRAFEVYPAPAPLPPGDVLASRIEQLSASGPAAARLSPPRFIPRTRKAHELAKLARAEGVDVRPSIFDAFWAAGRDIGRIDVLASIAGEAGLDLDTARIALDIDRFAPGVEADEQLARRLGIAGVPVIYVGTGANAIVLAGAVSAADLDDALRRS